MVVRQRQWHEDCPCPCEEEGCARCEDEKRPDFLLLNLANFSNEERFMATECDGGDVEASKACGVVSPTSNFNGAHQLDWISTEEIGGNCEHVYESGEFDAGDFYFGPFFCLDDVPPLSALDFNGDPMWLYGLKYRFRVVVAETGSGICDRWVYTIDAAGLIAALIKLDIGITTDWFCAPEITNAVITFSNGQVVPLELLFNAGGTFYNLDSPGPEGTYQTNELDTECGTVGAAPTITIESSEDRT